MAPAAVDLARVLDARVAGRREFQCGDRDCLNSCHLELAEIDVGGATAKIVSGGQCPKYDAVSAAGEKLPKDAPNPYRERDELLRALIDEEAAADGARGRRRGRRSRRARRPAPGPALRALPRRHAAVLPHAAARASATSVEVLRPGRDTLAEGDRRCAAPGACAPVKLLHGLAGADVDVFFAPIFVHLPLPNAGAQTYTCPMAQGAPDMVGRALRAEGSSTRVLRPVLFEKEGDGFDAPRVRRVHRPGHARAGGRRRGGAAHAGRVRRGLRGRRWTPSAGSRPACAPSASARSRGRASTATRWC